MDLHANQLCRVTLTLSVVMMLCNATQLAVADDILIQNVTLISPERDAPMLHADVLLQNGKIAKIGTNLTVRSQSRRVEGSGGFLIPGLIDSHVHVGHSAALDDDAMDGISRAGSAGLFGVRLHVRC